MSGPPQDAFGRSPLQHDGRKVSKWASTWADSESGSGPSVNQRMPRFGMSATGAELPIKDRESGSDVWLPLLLTVEVIGQPGVSGALDE
uniref:Uncharacterized protein n=1 Tax=Melanopsichium pennsylvanicum 4 TaxID=1398559 RepID=A0A077R9B8_9BASI|nr:uncharacterized protein BN887_06131 [Melanopsichium pennsylvanicum 4]